MLEIVYKYENPNYSSALRTTKPHKVLPCRHGSKRRCSRQQDRCMAPSRQQENLRRCQPHNTEDRVIPDWSQSPYMECDRRPLHQLHRCCENQPGTQQKIQRHAGGEARKCYLSPSYKVYVCQLLQQLHTASIGLSIGDRQ